MSAFATSYRTHTCGELRATDVPDPEATEETPPVALAGRVDARHEDETILLRDHYGKTLVTIAEDAEPATKERFDKLGLEDVVRVEGALRARPDDAKDKELETGEVQLEAREVEVLSAASGVPEDILRDETVAPEDRLANRQIYLRRPDMQARLTLRSKLVFEIRAYLIAEGFLELETPHLFWYDPVATAPEPVPVSGGRSFSLPSGPVVLDQYIKAGQFDRFFQFVRITRREDDPTPMHAQEYTGLDLNLAYVNVEDFCNVVDGLLKHVLKAVFGYDLKTPSPRLTWDEAMLRYGTDNPDVRFGLEVRDLSAKDGPVVRAFSVPGDKRKEGAQGAIPAPAEDVELSWAEVGKGGKLQGPGAKLLAGADLKSLDPKEGDLIVASRAKEARDAAPAIAAARLAMGKALELIDESQRAPVWVTGYPFFTWDEDVEDFVPDVVVFSQVNSEKDLETTVARPDDRHTVYSKAFDLVLDGVEVASAYIGNHNQSLQRLVWRNLLQMDVPDLVRLRAPIESHRFGIPPHGGMNLGFDRLVAVLLGVDALDEIMAFPKGPDCRDPFLDAPGPVPPEAVADLLEEAEKPTYTVDDLSEEVAKL